jgi:NhaP-type Na+/H+ or K+/H+ antiporter
VLAAGLFLVIRPVATMLTLRQTPLSRVQRAFIAWFGVRGIGSVYYLAYALSHGVSATTAQVMIDITLVVVTASIIVHGVSVTPLMRRYSARTARRAGIRASYPR